jgi:SulP family sulfate permease
MTVPWTTPWRHVARLLPRRADYAGLRHTWRADVVAGATVGVVALPLALAFGITTGMGAQAGLVTAIVAGLVAAVFGGSSVQVSGPTGAMTVVLVPVVARYGTDAVLVVSILAGLIVMTAAFLRVGRYLAFVPWPVVEGFTVGIAVIIFLQQVPPALGVAKPAGENTAVVAARAARAALAHGSAAAIGLVALVAFVMAVVPRLHRLAPRGARRHGPRRAGAPRRGSHRCPAALPAAPLDPVDLRRAGQRAVLCRTGRGGSRRPREPAVGEGR